MYRRRPLPRLSQGEGAYRHHSIFSHNIFIARLKSPSLISAPCFSLDFSPFGLTAKADASGVDLKVGGVSGGLKRNRLHRGEAYFY
jgi:hypothetical protein